MKVILGAESCPNKVSVYNVKYLGEAVKQTNKQNRKIVYKIENNLNF